MSRKFVWFTCADGCDTIFGKIAPLKRHRQGEKTMRTLAYIAFSFAAACALFVYVPAREFPAVACAALFALAVVLLILRKPLARRLGVIALGLAMGFAWCGGYFSVVYQPAVDAAGTETTLSASVCDFPRETKYGYSVTVRADLSGREVKTLLYLNADAPSLQPGDRISLPVRLERSSTDLEADDLYYNAKGVFLTASQKGELTLSRPDKLPLRDRPAMLLGAIKDKAAALFPENAVGFMTALLTGDKSLLSDADNSALKIAGVSHIIAVSGMHVSFLLSFVLFGTSGKRRSALIGIPTVLLFAALIGGTPGVMRAAVMYVFALAGPLFNREADTPTSLGAALMLMLLVNPWAIANVSLQLSFAATAGIFLFYGRLNKAMIGAKPIRELRSSRPKLAAVVRFFLRVLATTLSALVFTIPLSAYWFGTVSLIAPAANLIIVPLVSVLFVLGFAVVAVGAVLPAAGMVLAWPAAWLTRAVLGTAHLAAKVPYAQIGTMSVFVTAWLLFAYAVLILTLAFRPLRARPLLPVCLVVLTLAASLFLSALSFSGGSCSVTMLDVGQGQCIVITADGVTAVVDCGGSYGMLAAEQCEQLLANAGIARIDALILTHYDEDHAGSAAELMRRFSVASVYLPVPLEEDWLHDGIVETANAEESTLCYVRQDTLLTFGESELTVFAPLSNESDNDACLSVLFSHSDYDALITGDMNIETENRLLLHAQLPDLEVLAAGHHGSKYSTGAALLQMTTPEIVLISVGENKYGHPAAETLSRIESIDAAVYRTDLHGTVTVGR